MNRSFYYNNSKTKTRKENHFTTLNKQQNCIKMLRGVAVEIERASERKQNSRRYKHSGLVKDNL